MPAMKPSTLDAARSAVNDLTSERERANASLAEITAERERVALAALTGDVAAQQRRDELKREEADLVDHLRDVEPAIAQAERNFTKAWNAECRREEVADAKRRKALAGSLRAAGERADRSAREFAEALAEIHAIARGPDADGIPQLEFGRVRVHVMDAAHTAFQPVHQFMRPEERVPMAPSARHSFSEVLSALADQIDIAADQVIAGKGSETRKEAA